MALEAVVYQQDYHYFSNSSSSSTTTTTNNNNNNNGIDHLYPLLLESWQLDHDYLLGQINQSSSSEFGWHYNSNNYYCDYNGSTNNTCSTNVWDYSPTTTDVVSPPSDHSLPLTLNHDLEWAHNSSSSIDEQAQAGGDHHIHDYDVMDLVMTTTTRSKRRRARSKKNKEDIENQRMTHIAVERNRRKQMNDYLNVIRSLMPDSYVQRGDQASIIGGAINFVKELEQNLQCLSAKKQIKENLEKGDTNPSSLPFGEFFTFPQYSTTSTSTTNGGPTSVDNVVDDGDHDMRAAMRHHLCGSTSGGGGGGRADVADVEVTMVESHALLKIRTKKPPKQLSKLVSGVQGLRFTILHLNVTKDDGVALFSFSVKVEDESKLTSVDEIAGEIHQLLGRIQEEATFNC